MSGWTAKSGNDGSAISSQVNRAVRWVEYGLLSLLILYLCGHTMPRAWNRLNTDFPNYYLSARLAHEKYDTARMYEWVWLQRQKDHRAVDDKIIGLVPITPFSTLAIWPLTGLPPLTAKHIWLLTNLALLVPIGWMLHSMTGLMYRRIALVFALSFPLHRDLLYGQFYVILLALIVAGCWAYLRKRPALSGALIGVAAACKIFPLLLVVFFWRRRMWSAVIAGAITLVASVVASIAVFGWNLHRTYLYQVLPWALHGEVLPPYATASASISSILHYLFLSEPQWNPHPWHNSPLLYAVLLPALQMLALAPAILFIRPEDSSRNRILLEWSALLTAALTISTSPASYDFVLLALPICVLAAMFLQRKWYGWLGILLAVYLGIGFPMPSPKKYIGLAILMYVPRLPLLFLLLFGFYALLWRDTAAKKSFWNWSQYGWATVLTASLLFSIYSTFHLERGMRREYAYRLPLQTQAYLYANPEIAASETQSIALTDSGYHLAVAKQSSIWSDSSWDDDLSFIAGGDHVLVERAYSPRSKIVDVQYPSRVVVNDAREPMFSVDGQNLAFIRDSHGHGRLMIRRNFQSDAATEVSLTPPALNVYEASLLSEKEYAFSAAEGGRPPQIYLTNATHANTPLMLGESRYPALSPDKRWLAYSHLDHGVWNLWIRNRKTGTSRRIADVPCNQIQPEWASDSMTLIYGTDCGRSLWFTAPAQRRVVP